jgi:hypothetical protein
MKHIDSLLTSSPVANINNASPFNVETANTPALTSALAPVGTYSQFWQAPFAPSTVIQAQVPLAGQFGPAAVDMSTLLHPGINLPYSTLYDQPGLSMQFMPQMYPQGFLQPDPFADPLGSIPWPVGPEEIEKFWQGVPDGFLDPVSQQFLF